MGSWHPLTWISLQLDTTLFGPTALGRMGLSPVAGHHLVNVLLHAANAALVLVVLYRMTGCLGRSAPVAACFAPHPLHVESVAWVSERKDVLSVFFGLLALLAYVRDAAQPSLGRYFAVAGLFALSLTAKPMLVTLPLVLLLLDAWPLGRYEPGGGKRLILEKLPLLLLAAAVCVLTVMSQGAGTRRSRRWPALCVPPLHPREQRLRVVCRVPRPNPLADGPGDLLSAHANALAGAQVLACAALLAVLTAAAAAAARRYPWAAVGWLWFLITLLPVIGLVQVGEQALADRYTYWPHIGLLLALVWGLATLAERLRWRGVLQAAAAAAVLLAAAVLTWRQVGVWADSQALWSHALAVTGPNASARVGLGFVLEQAGQPEAALEQYRTAVSIDPQHVLAELNLGTLLCTLGKPAAALPCYEAAPAGLPPVGQSPFLGGDGPGDAGAVGRSPAQYQEAVRLRPGYAKAHYNLGLMLSVPATMREAEQHFRAAVQAQPALAEAHSCLGETLMWQQRTDEAAVCYRTAHALKPELASAADNLAAALESAGRSAEALTWAQEAVRSQPRTAAYHTTLALVLVSLGRQAAARQEYQAADRLDPRWPGAVLQLARLAATHPDSRYRCAPAAILAARKLAEAFPERPEGHDVLAEAYAEAGQFDRARQEAQQAYQRAAPWPKFAAAINRRLARYQSGRPYRDPSFEAPAPQGSAAVVQ